MMVRMTLLHPRLCNLYCHLWDEGLTVWNQDLCQWPLFASVAKWKVDFETYWLGIICQQLNKPSWTLFWVRWNPVLHVNCHVYPKLHLTSFVKSRQISNISCLLITSKWLLPSFSGLWITNQQHVYHERPDADDQRGRYEVIVAGQWSEHHQNCSRVRPEVHGVWAGTTSDSWQMTVCCNS